MTLPPRSFLDQIVDHRRRRIAEMEQRVPGHRLRSALTDIEPAGRLERPLRRGSSAEPLRLLCEVKRASPSRGLLNEHVDPVAMARLYEAGGAAAVSLVTEPDHFQGDPEWVDRVRPEVRLPILMKDFVVDSYQLLVRPESMLPLTLALAFKRPRLSAVFC